MTGRKGGRFADCWCTPQMAVNTRAIFCCLLRHINGELDGKQSSRYGKLLGSAMLRFKHWPKPQSMTLVSNKVCLYVCCFFLKFGGILTQSCHLQIGTVLFLVLWAVWLLTSPSCLVYWLGLFNCGKLQWQEQILSSSPYHESSWEGFFGLFVLFFVNVLCWIKEVLPSFLIFWEFFKKHEWMSNQPCTPEINPTWLKCIIHLLIKDFHLYLCRKCMHRFPLPCWIWLWVHGNVSLKWICWLGVWHCGYVAFWVIFLPESLGLSTASASQLVSC